MLAVRAGVEGPTESQQSSEGRPSGDRGFPEPRSIPRSLGLPARPGVCSERPGRGNPADEEASPELTRGREEFRGVHPPE